MTSDETRIDALLTSALRDENVGWPDGERAAPVIERMLYHGIAGLLSGRALSMADWPAEVRGAVHEQAIAQTMWELRHRSLLSELLAAFSRGGIVALLVKGTAVAYDLYATPAARSRGDSDVLIDTGDLPKARTVLEALGYRRQDACPSDSFSLQEVWSIARDRTEHHIDLHWQLMNSPALSHLLPFSECASNPIALPRLSPDALAMDRVHLLVHACAHRMMHVTAPYFIDDAAYYGGDRLIWAYDIHLLASALSEMEWQAHCEVALRTGLSRVCLDGLMFARRLFATAVPDEVRARLAASSERGTVSDYLIRSRQFGRAWQDVLAIPGLARKFAYMRARALPSPVFIRSKYPGMAGRPLLLLYLWRMVELLRVRSGRTAV